MNRKPTLHRRGALNLPAWACLGVLLAALCGPVAARAADAETAPPPVTATLMGMLLRRHGCNL